MIFDICVWCGQRVADFEPGGYENEDGQRGHFACDAEDTAAPVGAIPAPPAGTPRRPPWCITT